MKVRILPAIGTVGVAFVAFAAIATNALWLLIAAAAWVVMTAKMVQERRQAVAWDDAIAFWRSRTGFIAAGPVECELAHNMLAFYGADEAIAG